MLKDNIVNKITVLDGITYFYDSVRQKWLSTIHDVQFGINHRNIKNDRWLANATGIYSNIMGCCIPKKGTIIRIILQAQHETSCTFRIIADNNVLFMPQLADEAGKIIDVDIDFGENIALKCSLEISENIINYPTVILQYSYRL